MKKLKIICLGGGPAALYFSILMKKQNSQHEITIIERGSRDATWGFGVVFSDDTLHGFMDADAVSYKRIVEQFAYWDKIDTLIHGKKVTSAGHGFCGMSRLKLLNTLHDRCDELGVELQFNTDISDLQQLHMDNYDLVVAGDGITSMLREAYKTEFGTSIDVRPNHFCWLATSLPLDSFVFIFKENEFGWWWVHGYAYEEGMATWIVECSHQTWLNAGMDKASEDDTRQLVEELFKEELQGHDIITNRSVWRDFPVIRNERLYHKNIVLLGDAGRSAHFSIGSGTKLAMEDGIKLADCFSQSENTEQALKAYQVLRKPEADRLQRTAVTSLSWFEHIDRYASQSAEQFTFNMMARSKRVTYNNLALRDADYIRDVDYWFAKQVREETGFDDINIEQPVAPMFQPLKIGSMRIENRVSLSAMCQYCAEDGLTTDWHLVHYGSRGVGGVGLVNTEMLCTSAEGRITPGCAGIWTQAQCDNWTRIVDFIHSNSQARVCAQIGHAGRKGATCVPWDGGIDQPLKSGAWEIISASAIPYLENSQIPREMTPADMDRVSDDFVLAAKHALAAGFDMLEVHMAHGYLLSSFISPYTNRRTDEYGGDIYNRMRFPLRVLRAVQAVWPDDRPLSVRISATDWLGDEGLGESDMLIFAGSLKEQGVDIINVSTGQVAKEEEPVYGRMYQVPFADQIRNDIGIPTIVAGNISSADQVNTLIAAGRTDMVALARAIMNEPQFMLNAAARYQHAGARWPQQYLSGKFAAEALANKQQEEERELRLNAKPPNPMESLAIAIARGEVLTDK